MPVNGASHAHPVYMLLKHFGGQRLSKGICKIVCRCYLGDGNVTSLHNLSDQMILPFYVLLAFMASGFLGLGDCPTAVIVNCERLSRQRYHSKFYKRNLLTQTASLVASQTSTYLASKVESVVHSYLILFQLIPPQLSINTYPEVEFLESLSDMKS